MKKNQDKLLKKIYLLCQRKLNKLDNACGISKKGF